MKNLIILIAFLASTFNALSQGTWSRYYNVTSDAESVDILIPYRQGYLVGSNVFCSPLTFDGCTYLMYINKKGDIIKNNILSVAPDSSIGLSFFNSSIVNKDSTFTLCMKSDYTPTLVKFDTSLASINTHKYFSIEYILHVKSVFKLNENRYLLFNTTADKIVNTKQIKIWMVLVDSTFKQIKQYGQINADTFFVIDSPIFEKLKDGTFAAVFPVHLKGQSLQEDRYVGLMRFDSLGNTLWTRAYGPPPFDNFDYTTPVVKQLNNENIVFSGSLENYVSINYDMNPNYIQCVSLSGDSIWRTYFDYKYCNCYKRIFNITITKNGDILGVGFGFSFNQNSKYKGWLFCLSTEGKLKWERFYSYTDTLQNVGFYNIYSEMDGSLMIGSDAMDGIPKNPGLWILRLDSMGCMTPDCTGTDLVTAVKEVKEGYKELREVFFSISPNPANDIVNIDYFSPQPGRKISFNLFDMNGSLLQVIYADASIEYYTLPVRSLSSGIYTVSMLMNGNVVQTEKVVKN